MDARSHICSGVLALGAALAITGFLGCGPQAKTKNGERDHQSHVMADSRSAADQHHGHHGVPANSVLIVKTEPATIKPGELVKLHLLIRDATGGTIKDFETVHEKKLHLIIVRDGLDQFAHIHPEIDHAGNITATFTFPHAGTYRLYADYQPTAKEPAVAMAEVNVVGTPPPKPELIPNVPGRVKGDALAADIAVENGKAGQMTRIAFTLFDSAGQPVTNLQPYLGALGHLVVLSADGKQYVHAHPLEGKSAADVVAFAAHFPHAGIYKGWGQFRRGDNINDVPFVIKIE